MPRANTINDDILKLFLNGTPIANLADNATSSPFTNLYIALHTADPGAGGNQTTSECAYTGYARTAVARTTSGFTAASSQSSNPVSNINFPACTAGTETATHATIGTAVSGTGKILYRGPISPNLSIAAGTTPQIRNTSTVTET